MDLLLAENHLIKKNNAQKQLFVCVFSTPHYTSSFVCRNIREMFYFVRQQHFFFDTKSHHIINA